MRDGHDGGEPCEERDPTIAVDNSPGMCRQAREKARRAGVLLRVLRADMRTFRLPEPVDLMICEGDAINHLDRKAELTRVVRSVARATDASPFFKNPVITPGCRTIYLARKLS